MYDAITDVPGIEVGHYTNLSAATGCTVVLCEKGAITGVDVRGFSPGTRETDLLKPTSQVEKAHAILLTGGSAYGLDAAAGVMRFLEEKGVGYETPAGNIPIVPAAVIFDLTIGDSKIRPGLVEGYEACKNAVASHVIEGCVGAGTGAMVGHMYGPERATKSGLGTASETICGDVIVAAIVVVNAFGDVINPKTGNVLAGVRSEDGKVFADTTFYLKSGDGYTAQAGNQTTIGVIATNAILTKEQANKIAQMAHDGMARAIKPCHTVLDGDTVFAMATGDKSGDILVLGAAAADVMERAIIKAINSAVAMFNIPASRDIFNFNKDA